ncbi:MAG: lipopolysaccharide biosynthesis protein [Clostridium sp.]|nr:lipopolysaccharide biosynthesis protein [Clostridium sp.]
MEKKQTTSKVVKGLFWKLMENGGAQGVQFIVSVILARLLSPEEYSVVGVILIFVTIANVLVQNGFSIALIQKKEVDDRDFSSVFYFNMAVSLLLYGALFAAAPRIGRFYTNPEMTALIRALAVVLFPGGVISIQNAYVSRRLEFKGLFISSFIASVMSGGFSIFMAHRGWGVWALVWQQITYYFFYMCILFLTVSWKPRILFSLLRIKTMLAFGWKLLCASLLDTIYNNIYGLVIGKIYNKAMLGNYNRGEQFPKLVVNNLASAIQSVMLPVLSASQDEPETIKIMLRRAIMVSSYLILPMMAGMIAVAQPMVLLLLGEKWLPCVPFLQLMCIAYSFWPIHIANLQALNAMGHSEIFLKLEIIKKAVGIVVLIIGIRYNALVLVALKAAADFLCTFINAWPNKRLLNYSIFEQWKDIMPSIAASGLMAGAVWAAGCYAGGGWLGLGLQILFGIIVYIGVSWMFRLEAFRFLMGLAKERRPGGKGN